MTPAGIEPATFRFVAQHLNHCATAVPELKGPTIYNVCARDGEISTSGFCRVIINFCVECGGVLWLEAR